MASDLLSSICDEIDARLQALAPSLAEYEQLQAAAQALDARAAENAQVEISPDAQVPAAVVEPTTTRKRAARASRTRKVTSAASAPKARARRAPSRRRSEVDEAILGVLEHGSHTVAELGVVTALSAANINASLRKLVAQGAVGRMAREGKPAWTLTPRG